eukprot:CAMPEP_0201552368 /NCGR_PEP_ID=MMETSP0173_2-20130828/15465_1 /ASSEMBLY_ACC=CAM_ASM_000268 /TAXON_ID=218659 /ORGANISM="Vexillifera sp., Strain DIVA3 564/2" /LENGTH=343 /DNA_ID=CAMNT_0047962841 /DNA_START=29 /DNA_END=1060 /DNA_ORIENTATION=+
MVDPSAPQMDENQEQQQQKQNSVWDGFLLPLLIIFTGSLFYLTQAATICDDADGCNSYLGWAVAAGTVSMALTLVLGLLTWFDKLQSPLMHTVCSAFLVLWWTFGTGIGTFKEPFVGTGNGFFAGWCSFIGSVYYLWIASSAYRASTTTIHDALKKLGYLGNVFVLFASFVYMVASSIVCTDIGTCDKEFGWAVACAVISLVLCATIAGIQFFGGAGLSPMLHCIFAGFLIVWWGAGAGVGTFRKPFTTTSNGYFAAWGAFFSSLWYFHEAWMRYRGNAPDTYDQSAFGGAQGFDAPADGGFDDHLGMDSDKQQLVSAASYQDPPSFDEQQVGYSQDTYSQQV